MDRSELDSLYQIAQQISNQEIEQGKKVSSVKNRHANKIFVWSVIVPIILGLVIGFANKLFINEPILRIISVCILLISYLSIIAQPIIEAWLYKDSICRFISNPFSKLLMNSKFNANNDLPFITDLLEKKLEHLKFLKLELDAEKNAFSKRISLMVGALERIGLLPGVFGILVTISELGKEQSDWAYALAYATPILYLAGIGMHLLVSRLDRISQLVGYAIEMKESALTIASS